MATLSQIEQRIVQLQKKADEMRRKKAAAVITSIRKMMADHGLSIEDIAEPATDVPARRGRPAKPAAVVKTKPSKVGTSKVPAKYRDPDTGATWSGRARPPAWIKDVADRSKFLIK